MPNEETFTSLQGTVPGGHLRIRRTIEDRDLRGLRIVPTVHIELEVQDCTTGFVAAIKLPDNVVIEVLKTIIGFLPPQPGDKT